MQACPVAEPSIRCERKRSQAADKTSTILQVLKLESPHLKTCGEVRCRSDCVAGAHTARYRPVFARKHARYDNKAVSRRGAAMGCVPVRLVHSLPWDAAPLPVRNVSSVNAAVVFQCGHEQAHLHQNISLVACERNVCAGRASVHEVRDGEGKVAREQIQPGKPTVTFRSDRKCSESNLWPSHPPAVRANDAMSSM